MKNDGKGKFQTITKILNEVPDSKRKKVGHMIENLLKSNVKTEKRIAV